MHHLQTMEPSLFVTAQFIRKSLFVFFFYFVKNRRKFWEAILFFCMQIEHLTFPPSYFGPINNILFCVKCLQNAFCKYKFPSSSLVVLHTFLHHFRLGKFIFQWFIETGNLILIKGCLWPRSSIDLTHFWPVFSGDIKWEHWLEMG